MFNVKFMFSHIFSLFEQILIFPCGAHLFSLLSKGIFIEIINNEFALLIFAYQTYFHSEAY